MKKSLLIASVLLSTLTFSQTWNTTGNSGTTPTNNFIGTADDQDLVFRTNNKERLRILGGPYVNGISVGNLIDGYASGGARLELVSVLCTGCASNWAAPGDFVAKTRGMKNLEFHMANTNAVYPGADVSTPNSPDITRIKFTDGVHKSNLVVFNTGKVTVGTDQYDNDPNFIFYVKKGIKAEQVKVENPAANGWADYVFKKEYKLNSLEEVERHIQEKGHLSNIPSADEVVKNGINLGEMDAKLLEKIEELTLYSIEQNKQIKSQSEKIEKLEKQSEELKQLKEQVRQLLNTNN